MDELKATYNRIAEDWAREHQDDFRQWWIPGTEQFASLFDKGNVILDVGCGPGFFSRALDRFGLHVVGVDLSEAMIAIARKTALRSIFLVMDARDLSLADVWFDGIFAHAVLLHFSKQEVSEVLYGFKRNLRPGGYLYLAVKERKPGQAEEEVKKEETYGYSYERPFSYFTLDEMRGFLQELRFTIRSEEFVMTGDTRWIQIIARKERS